ncbi:AAA family ATPase [Acidisoma sp. C75]
MEADSSFNIDDRDDRPLQAREEDHAARSAEADADGNTSEPAGPASEKARDQEVTRTQDAAGQARDPRAEVSEKAMAAAMVPDAAEGATKAVERDIMAALAGNMPHAETAAQAELPLSEKLVLLGLDDLVKDASQADNFIFSGLEIGQVGLLLGAPGRGKSLYTIGAAVSVATGAEFAGVKPPKPFPVLVISPEDSRRYVSRRIIAAAVAKGADRSLLDQNLKVVKCDPPFRLFRKVSEHQGGGEISIIATKKGKNLLACIKETGARFVVIDPLIEVHNASENENGQMHGVMSELRALAIGGQCAILGVHHVAKLDGKVSLASSRGAGAITAAARYVMAVNEPDAASAATLREQGIDAIQIDVCKANHGRTNSAPTLLRVRVVEMGGFQAPVLELLKLPRG